MLSIEPVLDVLTHIDLVHHLIGILLQSGCKDDNLIVLSHEFDELDAAWSNQEEALLTVLYVMDECLVQVEYQSVDFVLFMGFQRRQEGWADARQIREVVREHRLLSGSD